MAKKDTVHLRLSEELSDIDAELEKAMEALTNTNERIDTFLNGEGEAEEKVEVTKELAQDAESAPVSEEAQPTE
jgi:uncharacterized protein YfcZ (UPF0381/DUF406 family)